MVKIIMTKDQAKKIIKTTLWVAISAALGFLISWVQGNPEMFGIYAPIINVVLVTLKQVFTVDETSNK